MKLAVNALFGIQVAAIMGFATLIFRLSLYLNALDNKRLFFCLIWVFL